MSTSTSNAQHDLAGGSGRLRALWFSLIALFYIAVPNARPDLTRFNCTDGGCYIALSHGLYHGLGYTRSMIEGEYIPHVTWPPGLPLLLLPAVALSGETFNWLAAKLMMATVGLMGGFFAWRLTFRITGNRTAADSCATVLLLNPFYWHFSHQTMTEVPLTVWCLASLLIVDRTWSERSPSWLAAAATGMFAGCGMLFKGHAAALAFVPMAYCYGARSSWLSLHSHVGRWLLYCVCFSIPFTCWLARNSTIDGATGFDGQNQATSFTLKAEERYDPAGAPATGSEVLSRIEHNVLQRGIYVVPHIAIPGLWSSGFLLWMYGTEGTGYVALALTMLFVGASVMSNAAMLPVWMVAGGVGAINAVHYGCGATRYWIPVCALLLIALVSRIAVSLGRHARAASVCGGILVVNLGAYVYVHECRPYNSTYEWNELVRLFEEIPHSAVEPSQRVLTPNPWTLQQLTGIRAPIYNETGDPVVDYMVGRSDEEDLRAPRNAQVVAESAPWTLYRLSRPMRASELVENPKVLDLPMRNSER